MDPEIFSSVMNVNVTQSWLISRSAASAMKKQNTGGKIVLVSSARGLLGHPAGYTAYCSSKAAIDGMTKSLGCELGEFNITVNAIAPTVFRSPLTAWMFEDNDNAKKIREGFLTRVPKGRRRRGLARKRCLHADPQPLPVDPLSLRCLATHQDLMPPQSKGLNQACAARGSEVDRRSFSSLLTWIRATTGR